MHKKRHNVIIINTEKVQEALSTSSTRNSIKERLARIRSSTPGIILATKNV
uniref:Uncharacterized protein n=1 Tax=Arundo donax TaxID=35708 RepID=A0A0A9BG77_ARUDO